jgi:hypothetical protein
MLNEFGEKVVSCAPCGSYASNIAWLVCIFLLLFGGYLFWGYGCDQRCCAHRGQPQGASLCIVRAVHALKKHSLFLQLAALQVQRLGILSEVASLEIDAPVFRDLIFRVRNVIGAGAISAQCTIPEWDFLSVFLIILFLPMIASLLLGVAEYCRFIREREDTQNAKSLTRVPSNVHNLSWNGFIVRWLTPFPDVFTHRLITAFVANWLLGNIVPRALAVSNGQCSNGSDVSNLDYRYPCSKLPVLKGLAGFFWATYVAYVLMYVVYPVYVFSSKKYKESVRASVFLFQTDAGNDVNPLDPTFRVMPGSKVIGRNVPRERSLALWHLYTTISILFMSFAVLIPRNAEHQVTKYLLATSIIDAFIASTFLNRPCFRCGPVPLFSIHCDSDGGKSCTSLFEFLSFISTLVSFPLLFVFTELQFSGGSSRKPSVDPALLAVLATTGSFYVATLISFLCCRHSKYALKPTKMFTVRPFTEQAHPSVGIDSADFDSMAVDNWGSIGAQCDEDVD